MKMTGCYKLRPLLLLRDGFSLIEVMIAMVILMIGLLGFLSLQITAIQVNEVNKRLIIAEEAATQEIEKTKTVGYTGLTTNTILTTTMLMTGPNEWGYYNSFGSLPPQYQFAGIDTSCVSPYTYCVYKGITASKTVGGNAVNYDHTVKLSVVVNYLSYPVLQQCQITIYWVSKGELKQINYVFFNEYKT